MRAQGNDRRGYLMPMIVAGFVAIVGQTAILFNDFGLILIPLAHNSAHTDNSEN